MTTIKVMGLPSSFTLEQLRRLFEPFGPLHSVHWSAGGPDGGRYHCVEMNDHDAAEEARKLLEGIVFADQPLHLVLEEGQPVGQSYSAVA